MKLDRPLLSRLDLVGATATELELGNRLLPTRWDYSTLALESTRVSSWLRAKFSRHIPARTASIVFADKGWRGVRPLHILTLEDRVAYRALVGLISRSLPIRLQNRPPIDEFRNAPLAVPNVSYISKTDVTAYYEYVDHDLLCSELLAQTGEAPAIDALSDLLDGLLGRRVGLPQVHPASDILGDTYIDPARRRLLRRGHATFTYSDDFRIASSTLGEARAALEACGFEVRRLGLVLNERKTYTYGDENYRRSLTSFSDAEQALFEGDEPQDDAILGFLDPDYDDDDDERPEVRTLGPSPVDGSLDESEAFAGDLSAEDFTVGVDPRRVRAAERVWEIWEEEDDNETSQAGQEAAITQSLLGRALPTLGAAGDRRPLSALSTLLRLEPALTPHVAAYVRTYANLGRRARADLRSALDEVTASDILSNWQAIWIAHSAGEIRRSVDRHSYEDWLSECLTDGHDGLAATAAATIGRIGRGDPAVLAAAVQRVGPEWRRLAFWGLARLDKGRAEQIADDAVDHLLLSTINNL